MKICESRRLSLFPLCYQLTVKIFQGKKIPHSHARIVELYAKLYFEVYIHVRTYTLVS